MARRISAMSLGPTPDPDRPPATAPPSVRVELLWAPAGADGFVAGTGGDHVTPALADSLVRLARTGRPVVLSRRCGGSSQVYAGNGSETHMLCARLLSAGSLSQLKAKLRLLFGCSAGLRTDELFAPHQDGCSVGALR